MHVKCGCSVTRRPIKLANLLPADPRQAWGVKIHPIVEGKPCTGPLDPTGVYLANLIARGGAWSCPSSPRKPTRTYTPYRTLPLGLKRSRLVGRIFAWRGPLVRLYFQCMSVSFSFLLRGSCPSSWPQVCPAEPRCHADDGLESSSQGNAGFCPMKPLQYVIGYPPYWIGMACGVVPRCVEPEAEKPGHFS